MSVKNSLTNEKLNEKFDNSFSLVNYAIGLAKNLVKGGEEFDSNAANDVLERIVDNRDSYLFNDEEDEEEDEDEEEEG